MIYYVYSVVDAAIGAYGRPIFVAARGLAVRSFQDEVNRVAPDNEMNRHPEDFKLFYLGTFDDETGNFATLPMPEFVTAGSAVVGK